MRPATAGASASASTPATGSHEPDTPAHSLPAAQPPPTSIPVSRRLSSAVSGSITPVARSTAPLSFVGGSSPRRTLQGHGHGPQTDHPAIHPVAATAAGIPPPPSPFGFLSPRPALAPGSPAGTRASAATPVSSMGGYGSFWRAPAAPVFSNSSLSPSSSLQSFVPQYSTMGSRHGGGGGAYYVGTAGGGGSGQAGAGSPRPGNTSHAAWGAGNASAAAAQGGSASAPNADNLKWSAANFNEGTTFQENSAVSYTWNIRDVQLLREEVERSPAPSEGGRSVSAGAGKSEVWTTQPIFGDGKWKLELVRTKRPSDEADDAPIPSDSFADEDTPPEAADKGKGSTAGTTVLSVYLTSLALSNVSPHLFQRAYIMLGIKPVRHWSGVHSHRAGSWLWRHFEAFDFTKENDYWECHQLPSLSELLLDGDVEEQDAFSLTVQIAIGPGVMPFTPGETLDNTSSTLDCRSTSTVASRTATLPFELPGALHVPRSLLSSLEALVDCAQTGDVRILVRERGIIRSGAETHASLLAEDLHRVELYPVGAAIPLFEEEDDGEGGGAGATDPLIVVRDRVIWAHSAVLRARSEYFAHMLDSAFVEGRGGAAYGAYNQQQQQSGARQVHTIRIPDSDFTTVYWVVRHLYLDEIEFSRDEDVRGAAFDEDWMMRAQDSEAAEVAAAAAAVAPTLAFPSPLDEPVWDWRTLKEVVGEGDVGGTTSTDSASPTSYSAAALAPSRHALSDRGSIGSSSSSTQQAPTPASAPLRRGWHTDPHMHPTPPAAPASSLAIYRLAHRYLLPHLTALSSAHLVSSLTPRSAFPVLLATSLFDDVHAGVTRYVFQHWELVNETHEFARCCDEVGRGEWGAQAGNALRLFMRHLVSPARVVGRAAA